MIDRKRLTGPRARRRPRFCRRRPEGVGRRQPERQQRDRAQIKTAGRDVLLTHAGLMTAEPDPKPTGFIERARSVDRPPDRRSERRARLTWWQSVGQRSTKRHLCEQMERAEAVRERAADRRERARPG